MSARGRAWLDRPGRPTTRGQRGVSIFEVLIAFIVLQTGLLVSLQALMTGQAFGAQARRGTYGSLAAKMQMAHVIRDVLPNLTAADLAAAGTEGYWIPPTEEPVPVPAELADGVKNDLFWQAVILPVAEVPGLYEVTVAVSFPGPRRSRASVSLTTRVYRDGRETL